MIMSEVFILRSRDKYTEAGEIKLISQHYCPISNGLQEKYLHELPLTFTGLCIGGFIMRDFDFGHILYRLLFYFVSFCCFFVLFCGAGA
jgi:hypothetical protein